MLTSELQPKVQPTWKQGHLATDDEVESVIYTYVMDGESAGGFGELRITNKTWAILINFNPFDKVVTEMEWWYIHSLLSEGFWDALVTSKFPHTSNPEIS